jgi:polysaccharide export outer membrane protein
MPSNWFNFLQSRIIETQTAISPYLRTRKHLWAGESEMNIWSSNLKILTFTLILFSAALPAAGQKILVPNLKSGEQPATSNNAPQATLNKTGLSLPKPDSRDTVHPSDTLELTFMLTPEFNQTVTVHPDGHITLRDIGNLLAAGHTLPELTESIKTAYSKILHDPVISVNPKDFGKPSFADGGHVGKPGNAATDTQTVSGYVLGPDDEIMIRGIDAPEVSDKLEKPDQPVLIGTNGDITLPLIGRVKVGGLTVEQLEAELNTRFRQFIQEPQISVTVTVFRSQPVSVFGAVTKPGVVQLRGRQTLYEVLSMAGGPRDTAGSILTVMRPRQSGEIPLPGVNVDPTGQFSTAELNVQEILEGKNAAANIEIRPNDIISVSEASSNMIYVVGDVQHAGAFTLGGQRNVSVLRAVSLAGGFGHTAKPEKARIVHEVSGEPKLREVAVNIQQIISGKAKDVELGPDDVLVVPTSSRKIFTTDFLPNAFSTVAGAAIYHY